MVPPGLCRNPSGAVSGRLGFLFFTMYKRSFFPVASSCQRTTFKIQQYTGTVDQCISLALLHSNSYVYVSVVVANRCAKTRTQLSKPGENPVPPKQNVYQVFDQNFLPQTFLEFVQNSIKLSSCRFASHACSKHTSKPGDKPLPITWLTPTNCVVGAGVAVIVLLPKDAGMSSALDQIFS